MRLACSAAQPAKAIRAASDPTACPSKLSTLATVPDCSVLCRQRIGTRPAGSNHSPCSGVVPTSDVAGIGCAGRKCCRLYA